MRIKDIHPNNVKRINRLRNLEGKHVFYLPTNSILADTELEKGSRVVIEKVAENNEDKKNTIVKVTDYYNRGGKQYSVLLKDLGFPHNRD